MAGMCGCCGALRPRYKRLVDSIFPADPQEGLVKSNMDKLTFFAMKSPEKLDRIGDYLEYLLSRHVYRQRYGYVFIAMEALDTLLITCHAQSLNLFVESFLKMVQKLMEQREPELQCVATSSFVKFANIEEVTPSYHRRYDFFVSRFSTMCHSSVQDPDVQTRVRVAGLRGLHGVVRKTVSDNLQVNIWECTHMDKIVPSLLFNMEQNRDHTANLESPSDEEQPAVVAENVFRDLVCRASYGNINSVIKPVLAHLDNFKLWVPNEFAVKCFKIIMYSVQAQYGYVVVQMLMNHLDVNSKSEPKIKAGIVDVLSETVLIAAGGSIGPSVLEVFNSLLRHLRSSVDNEGNDPEKEQDEKNFQEAVINTIGEFANNLPDYQKIEILMFVMGKVPMPCDGDDSVSTAKEVMLQTMLMKTILKVATKYKTVLMANAFPSAFLEPLLRMSLVNDPGIRRIVQEILHTLIDRHGNAEKLRCVRAPTDINTLGLQVEKAPRQDVMFMKKNGSLFYWHLYENMQMNNNKVDNFESLFCTMALLSIEMGGDEVLIELFRLALSIQNSTEEKPLPITHKCAIQALIGAYLNLISQLTAIPALCQHVQQVIETRKNEAEFYLPDIAFNRRNTASSYPTTDEVSDAWLFNLDKINDALHSSGHDTSRLATPFMARPTGLDLDMFDSIEKIDTVDMSHSASDLASIISVDLESTASTPSSMRRGFDGEEKVTFDSLKKVLEINPRAKEEAERKRKQIYESFRSGPFEEIVARSEAQSTKFHDKVNEILDLISGDSPTSSRPQSIHREESIPLYEMQFPELFVY